MTSDQRLELLRVALAPLQLQYDQCETRRLTRDEIEAILLAAGMLEE